MTLFQSIEIPEEKFHFIEYGFLSALLFARWHSFAKSVLVSSGVGIVEEYFQMLAPERYFDEKDILINCVGSLYGAILFYWLNKK